MSTFSERLRKGIEMAGVNITQASELTGIPYRSLQNYLQGDREPKAEALARIKAGLGISVDWLLTGDGSPLGVSEGPPERGYGAGLSSGEEAVLAVYRALDSEAQREIQAVAAEKKRLREIERQLKDLKEDLADCKRSA